MAWTLCKPCTRFGLPFYSGRGAVWLARLNGVQEVGGSNPLAPTSESLVGRELPARLFSCFGPALGQRAELRAEFRKRPPPAVNGRRPTRTFRSGLAARPGGSHHAFSEAVFPRVEAGLVRPGRQAPDLHRQGPGGGLPPLP